MPKFIVTTLVTATVRETWEVEADSPEDVEDALWEGNAEHIKDETTGNETDREIISVEEVTPA